MRLLVYPVEYPLAHEILIPNSKSHAQRALILASLARGRSRIVGLTHAKHIADTIRLLRALGTGIRAEGNTLIVEGGAYQPTASELSAGSSGETIQLMIGLCAIADNPVKLRAQHYSARQPLRPLLEGLQQLGVTTSADRGYPPIEIARGRPKGGDIALAGASCRFLSSLLLVAPFAAHETTIDVDGSPKDRAYGQLTVSLMRQFGLAVELKNNGNRYIIAPNQRPSPTTIKLPPDVGVAAFAVAIAALHPADILLRGLTAVHRKDVDHPEAAFLEVVQGMNVPMQRDLAAGGVWIRNRDIRLKSVQVDCRAAPDMLPAVAALATFAAGESVIENIDLTDIRTSEWISALLQLNQMGARLRMRDFTLTVHGVDRLKGRDLSSFNDHRVLMALAVAATRASETSRLTYPHAYRISYPEFPSAMKDIGARMECVA